MTKQVIIVDYGMGNLHSVRKAVAAAGGAPVVTGDAALVAAADTVILPGVGAFGDCMRNMGWNSLQLKAPCPLLDGAGGRYVYFVHSYCCEPADKGLVTAVTGYGYPVVAAVQKGRVTGFQFHPEKSSAAGLEMLRKFIDL